MLNRFSLVGGCAAAFLVIACSSGPTADSVRQRCATTCGRAATLCSSDITSCTTVCNDNIANTTCLTQVDAMYACANALPDAQFCGALRSPATACTTEISASVACAALARDGGP